MNTAIWFNKICRKYHLTPVTNHGELQKSWKIFVTFYILTSVLLVSLPYDTLKTVTGVNKTCQCSRWSCVAEHLCNCAFFVVCKKMSVTKGMSFSMSVKNSFIGKSDYKKVLLKSQNRKWTTFESLVWPASWSIQNLVAFLSWSLVCRLAVRVPWAA